MDVDQIDLSRTVVVRWKKDYQKVLPPRAKALEGNASIRMLIRLGSMLSSEFSRVVRVAATELFFSASVGPIKAMLTIAAGASDISKMRFSSTLVANFTYSGRIDKPSATAVAAFFERAFEVARTFVVMMQ